MPDTSVQSILIVDDEPAVRDIISRWAESLDLDARTAGDADEALETLRDDPRDLAVVDVMMPGRDGFWLANELHRQHPQTAVVLATSDASRIDEAPDAPVVADLLIKPFARDRFLMALDRSRQWRKETLEEQRWNAGLARDLRERIDGIARTLDQHRENGADEQTTLLSMAEASTGDTMEHAERVLRYAQAVGRMLDMAATDLALLEGAARFHDIGKLAIPECLLNKPSPLSAGERAVMRQHVDAGADILASTATLSTVAPIVFASHEWFGGGGYPRNLRGDAIPLASRIIAVVDAYDAMTQDRHYRTRLGTSEAIGELVRCRGTQFDPAVVAAFLSVLEQH